MGDCHWELEKGLADPNGVSFRSMSYPNKYLALHGDGRVYLKECENTPEFKKSATWFQRKGNHEGLHSSFESVARPGEFMKHKGGRLGVFEIKSGGDKYDSTFELIE
ncbi:MAG: AbfB domain-containing protein [Opitutales bacterium]|nr:AbfB domain-containing protein [Opitutales bacterium]